MAVASDALTTLTNLKTALRVSVSSDDTLLEKIIDRTTDWIENKCNRKFKARKYNNGGSTHGTTGVADEDYVYFDGHQALIDENTGLGMFYLPQFPVQANSVLTFNLAFLTDRDSSGDTWDTSELVEGADYIVDRVNGILRLLGGIYTHGVKNYRVTMAAGYQLGSAHPYVPDDLEALCIELCKGIYKENRNLQSESIGTWSRTYAIASVDPFIADTLAKYTRTIL